MSNQDQSGRWRGTYSEVHDLRAIGEIESRFTARHLSAPLHPPPTLTGTFHQCQVSIRGPVAIIGASFLPPIEQEIKSTFMQLNDVKCQCYHATMAKPLNIYVYYILLYDLFQGFTISKALASKVWRSMVPVVGPWATVSLSAHMGRTIIGLDQGQY